MVDKAALRRDPVRCDPSLIRICRKMTPVERLEAAVHLSELTFRFYLAGVEHREALRDGASTGEAQRS